MLQEETNFPAVPVTIVTGFLGAGKSTLLKHLLSENKNKKIAILLNEFGQSMEIEKLTIKNNDESIETEDWIELENGCICCSAKDSAVVQLERLMDAKGAFDHIVIETSGIADPGPIVTTFWLDDALNGRVKFDGVVCVVDSWNLQISQPPMELIRQLTYANVVLLNKLDLLKGENAKIIAICAFIRNINSECSIYECSYSQIPELSSKIFNLGGMQAIGNNMKEFAALGEFHYLSYDKLSVPLPAGSLEYDAMESFIQNLLWERKISHQEFPQMEIYRIKGIFKTADSTFLVHSVKEVYEITQIDQSVSTNVKEFKLILIGQNLPLEQTIKEFFDCYLMARFSLAAFRRIQGKFSFATFNGPALDGKWRERIAKLPVFPQSNANVQFLFPPPNVTGSLHLGHALTGAIQDSIARFENLRGKNVTWIPGFDHAGIATLAVIKNQQSTNSILSSSSDKEQLLSEIQKFSSQSKDKIRNQLKAMGFCLDWSKEYFTMDQDYSTFVQECFIELFERGLIYRKEAFINWSPASKSALADVEVETVALEGRKHFQLPGGSSFQFGIIYRIEFSPGIAVFTTRPETCFGDVALAVHPADERYNAIVGTFVKHPITGKEIPIVADEAVDMEFGSGILKITPLHSAVDYEIASRNGLLNVASKVIDEAGCVIAPEFPEFHGKDRFAVRAMLSTAFKLEQHEHTMNLQICKRTRDIIEQVRCPQWFFKSSAFKESLADLDALQIEVFPLHHRKRWKQWAGEMKDWCISRQIVWGNPIPVVFVQQNATSPTICIAALTEEEAKVKAEKEFGIDTTNPEFSCKRETDVLDTWFSSCLAPLFVKGSELNFLETGHDILYFWVMRMVVLSLSLREKVPFHRIMLHPMLKSRLGKKMSKSEPSGTIDPLDIIFPNEKNPLASGFGSDALKIALLGHSTNELFMSFDAHDAKIACHFGKKLENCAHFIEINQISVLQESNIRELPWKTEFPPESFNPFEQYLASKYNEMLLEYKKGFDEFEIFKSLKAAQAFVLDELCRNHIEYSKAIFYSSVIRPEDKVSRISFLRAIFLRVCMLLSPFCPVLVHELLEKFDELKLILQPDTSLTLEPINLGNVEVAASNAQLVTEFYSRLSTPTHKRSEPSEHLQKFIDRYQNIFLHMQKKRPANVLYMS